MDKRLADVLSGVFGLRPGEISMELRKDDVESWDSLKQMDLVLSLEKEYAVVLDIPDIIRMTSVADIAAVLMDKGVKLGD